MTGSFALRKSVNLYFRLNCVTTLLICGRKLSKKHSNMLSACFKKRHNKNRINWDGNFCEKSTVLVVEETGKSTITTDSSKSKLKYFLLSFYLHQTLKRTILSEISSQAFIERWKIKIRAFPRTSRKRFWNGRAMDWRLRDGNVGLHAGKEFCASFCASPIAGLRRAVLCVYCVCLSLRVLTETEWNVRGANVCSFLFICLFFFSPSLENYFGFSTTNVKGKTDHSFCLRWNKRFWTFLKRRVFFLIVHPINLWVDFAGLN